MLEPKQFLELLRMSFIQQENCKEFVHHNWYKKEIESHDMHQLATTSNLEIKLQESTEVFKIQEI